MSKELTDKWKNGELQSGNYYTICYKGWSGETFPCILYHSRNMPLGANVKEVLERVPSYDEHKELLRHSELSRNLVYEVLVNQKEYNELLDKAKENKRLQEQIKEANEIISTYRCYDDTDAGKATEYCKKWGVK